MSANSVTPKSTGWRGYTLADPGDLGSGVAPEAASVFDSSRQAAMSDHRFFTSYSVQMPCMTESPVT
jgi:hypothetical protein